MQLPLHIIIQGDSEVIIDIPHCCFCEITVTKRRNLLAIKYQDVLSPLSIAFLKIKSKRRFFRKHTPKVNVSLMPFIPYEKYNNLLVFIANIFYIVIIIAKCILFCVILQSKSLKNLINQMRAECQERAEQDQLVSRNYHGSLCFATIIIIINLL